MRGFSVGDSFQKLPFLGRLRETGTQPGHDRIGCDPEERRGEEDEQSDDQPLDVRAHHLRVSFQRVRAAASCFQAAMREK